MQVHFNRPLSWQDVWRALVSFLERNGYDTELLRTNAGATRLVLLADADVPGHELYVEIRPLPDEDTDNGRFLRGCRSYRGCVVLGVCVVGALQERQATRLAVFYESLQEYFAQQVHDPSPRSYRGRFTRPQQRSA